MTAVADMKSGTASEGARSATRDSAAGGPNAAPAPAVAARTTRRRFTAEYKLRILHEADALQRRPLQARCGSHATPSSRSATGQVADRES